LARDVCNTHTNNSIIDNFLEINMEMDKEFVELTIKNAINDAMSPIIEEVRRHSYTLYGSSNDGKGICEKLDNIEKWRGKLEIKIAYISGIVAAIVSITVWILNLK